MRRFGAQMSLFGDVESRLSSSGRSCEVRKQATLQTFLRCLPPFDNILQECE
jgi:hypothetical protein